MSILLWFYAFVLSVLGFCIIALAHHVARVNRRLQYLRECVNDLVALNPQGFVEDKAPPRPPAWLDMGYPSRWEE